MALLANKGGEIMPPFGQGWGGFMPGWGMPPFWWGVPTGVPDVSLYDYNQNQVLDDEEIVDVIMDNIEGDPGIPLSDEHRIKVEVKNGIATLSGEVFQPRTVPFAYADAWWAPGVREVVNNLKVKTGYARGVPARGVPVEGRERK